MARSETEKPAAKSAEHYMKNPNLTESEFTAHLGLDLMFVLFGGNETYSGCMKRAGDYCDYLEQLHFNEPVEESC